LPTAAFSVLDHPIRWRFDDGPTAGSVYEHTFHPDGSVSYREVRSGKETKSTTVQRSAVWEVAPEVHMVSYLGDSGYTLTIAMNLVSGRIYGVASKSGEWFPVTGSMEIAE
jgi:hypothetical protein